MLDSGSQRSYILCPCAKQMKLNKIGEESIVQGVFGAHQSTSHIHDLFDMRLNSFEFNDNNLQFHTKI